MFFHDHTSLRDLDLCELFASFVFVPLNQDLQKLPESLLELWDWFPDQHQFLPQLPVHSEQLLTPDRERDNQHTVKPQSDQNISPLLKKPDFIATLRCLTCDLMSLILMTLVISQHLHPHSCSVKQLISS